MSETLRTPLALFRHHGYGDLRTVQPIVSSYKTKEDYVTAVKYNLIHRPSHALFSTTEILNQGTLTLPQAKSILARIKKGEFAIPKTHNDISKLHSH